MLLKDGENVAIERRRRNVVRLRRSFCFLRSKGRQAQQRSSGGTERYFYLHSWISYAYSEVGCKAEPEPHFIL